MSVGPPRDEWIDRFAMLLVQQAPVTTLQAQAIAPRIYQSLFVLPPEVAAKLVVQIRMLRKPDLEGGCASERIRGDRRRP
ncbi:hypothetical protein [Rhizobacter sp. Root404]|jgi:hypothetical protein|uniref:hypothetical protein n=1 Tax=Rhizobacter sp. Root404 TaxID=1736528 RepID=UPI000701166C|nr:hypothetical protein [Rhizobacter sp. Root404]KQW40602.1 hypothetical protein ASC76_04075 [Rhizobacter sp. Root404]